MFLSLQVYLSLLLSSTTSISSISGVVSKSLTLFISLLLPHSTMYNPITISTAPITLPTYSFSSNIKEPATATSTSSRGLKTDANNGPLILTHHAITTTIIPEATIPEYAEARSLMFQPNLHWLQSFSIHRAKTVA
ncbi:hypothetical protein V8G54_034355 [Vigna mungo]|uniref:Uncharacterized protein n=1 Tax=Vigna mungo TaxID=3915 RepID=A0AAQ3MQ34_VIGMU